MTKKNDQAWERILNAPEAEPDELDRAMMREAEQEDDGTTMSLEDFNGLLAYEEALKGYSGAFTLRLPRDLHRQLAETAKIEGISINQLCLYHLTRAMQSIRHR